MTPISAVQQTMPGIGQVPMPAMNRPIPAAELEKLAGSGDSMRISANQGASPTTFAGVLEKMVTGVNNKQFAASQAVQDLQNGQTASLHQTMIALEEASVSFQLMVEVRNKVLESYQELMRMQV